MIISPHAQGSVDWSLARAGIPTASEFNAVVSDTFEIRKGEMPRTYTAKKLAEAWLGGPLAEFNTFDMEQGSILEGEAIPWFSFEHNTEVQRVGLITTDDGRFGCSPDGLLDGGGIEIKCPRPETHIRYLLKGVLPPEYAVQVHSSMFVTGAKWWKFLSYRRRFSPLLLTIERNDKIQAVLAEALASFLDAFDKGWAKLCELNGGPPKRRQAQPAAEVKAEPEYVDIIA